VFTLAVYAPGRIIYFRAGIIRSISVPAAKDTARLTFAGSADMTHSITRKTYFDLGYKGKDLISISTKKHVFGQDLSHEFQANSSRRNVFSFSINSDSSVQTFNLTYFKRRVEKF